MNTNRPMMACGHSANATNGKGNPSCAICVGIHPGAETVVATPKLNGRTARCIYYSKRTHKSESSSFGGMVRNKEVDGKCYSEADSNMDLPFFTHNENGEFDGFYCGCHSWD